MTRRITWMGTMLAALLLAGAGVGGCQALTRGEASAALEEASLDAEAISLTSGSIEITTDFTIGDAVENAAAEIATFVQTQLPCAEITVEAATITIEYGANPGTCTYRGQTYGGIHQITVMRNAMDDVIVSHRWEDFHNDDLSVTGTAMVTWSFADPSRHVVHELTWTRQSDGRQGTGSGDRIQRPLAEGLLTGFSEDGTRQWEGESGTWTLDIEGVEVRWVDAVPQAGSYVLTTPASKMLSLSFSRSAATTITVTISSGMQTYDFDVTTLPGDV
ncbi:MAG: hypothetical protein H6719_35370 [Sandaracinaceae bacterium]|nr:hypothetical protein [Sandaracinaceae bacterium]